MYSVLVIIFSVIEEVKLFFYDDFENPEVVFDKHTKKKKRFYSELD